MNSLLKIHPIGREVKLPIFRVGTDE